MQTLRQILASIAPGRLADRGIGQGKFDRTL